MLRCISSRRYTFAQTHLVFASRILGTQVQVLVDVWALCEAQLTLEAPEVQSLLWGPTVGATLRRRRAGSPGGSEYTLTLQLLSPGSAGHPWCCLAPGAAQEGSRLQAPPALLQPLRAPPLLFPALPPALQQLQGFRQIQTRLPRGEREGI